MRPKRGDAVFDMQRLQHLDSTAAADDERLAKRRQRFAQLSEAFGEEGPLPTRHVRLLPEIQLDDEQR